MTDSNHILPLPPSLPTNTHTQPLTDQLYGISKQAVRLKRKVEMYQWIEESETRLVEYVLVSFPDSDISNTVLMV